MNYLMNLKNGQVMEVAIKKLQIINQDETSNENKEADVDTSGHDIIVKRFIYEASKFNPRH